MKRWLALLVFTFCLSVDSHARNPYTPQFPPCDPGDMGYWGALVDTTQKPPVVAMALLARDFMDPANVICYLKPDAKVMVLPPEKQVRY